MYKYKYIDEIPEPFEVIEAYLGKIVHKALEYLYSEKEIVGLDDLIDYFVEAWEEEKELPIRIVRRNEYESQYIELGKNLLCDYYYSEYEKDPYETIETEKYFKLLLSKKYLYSGKIDRIAKDDKGVFHIIDFKTSKNIFSFEDEFKSLQIKGYGVSSLIDYDLEKVNLHYIFLRYNEDIVSFFEKKHANKVIAGLTKKIDRIESTVNFPPIKTGLCGWCRFRDECKSNAYSDNYPGEKNKIREGFDKDEELHQDKKHTKIEKKESASKSCIRIIDRYIDYSEKKGNAKKSYPITDGKSFKLDGKQHGEYLTYTDSFIPEESIGELTYRGKSYKVSVSSYNPKTGIIVFMSESAKLPDIDQNEEGRFIVDMLWLYKQLLKSIEQNSSQIDLSFIPNNLQLISTRKKGRKLRLTFEEILDEHQQMAIKDSSNMRLGYIWGPPGTGKTIACLAGLVDALLNDNQKVVILAFTNAAVNVIFQALLKLVDNEVVKDIGKKRLLIWPNIEKVFLDKSLVTASYLNSKSKKLKDLICEELSKERYEKIQSRLVRVDRKINSLKSKLSRKININQLKSEKVRLSVTLGEISSIKEEMSEISEEIKKLSALIKEYSAREPSLGELIFGGHKRKLEKMQSEKSRAEYRYNNIKQILDEYKESESVIIENLNSISKFIELKEERKKLSNEKKKLFEEGEITPSKHIFLGTFASMLSRLDLLPTEYHLIIDEASSAPAAWLLPFVTGAEKITFLGDHMQLPAVYAGDETDIEMMSWLKSSVLEIIRGLKAENGEWQTNKDLTLKELELNCSLSILKKSYRLPKPIAKISDSLWYKIGLKGVSPSTSCPLIIADTSMLNSYTEKEVVSRRNSISAEYIVSLIKKGVIQSSDIMIICPYRGQVKLYQKLFREKKLNIPVLTVHRAQGSEAETVIFDVTDGRGLAPFFTLEKQFGGSEKKSNILSVALTRSIYRTIIVADKSFWINKYPKSSISIWINEAKSLSENSYSNVEKKVHIAKNNVDLESFPYEQEPTWKEKDEDKEEKIETIKVCGCCKWFELKKLSMGKCGSSTNPRYTVRAGDEACLAFQLDTK